MTRRTAREMAQDRLATAERKTAAVEARVIRAGAELRAVELALREAEAAEAYARARVIRAGAELRAAELALREAEAAEAYARAHPLLAEPVLTEAVSE